MIFRDPWRLRGGEPGGRGNEARAGVTLSLPGTRPLLPGRSSRQQRTFDPMGLSAGAVLSVWREGPNP
jgi:hypothetical protein